VLTGGARRVEAGLALLAAEPQARLIVSGVGRETEWADLARLAGADPALGPRVTLGRAAASTRGNAAEIAAWARANRLGRLRIVTADYHMPRALLELRRALPEAVLLADPVAAAAPPGTVWREAAKYGLARLGLTRWVRRIGEAGA
jgi:uncharacterized SAM-binding protein YcdF (DUF218 family)